MPGLLGMAEQGSFLGGDWRGRGLSLLDKCLFLKLKQTCEKEVELLWGL